MKNNSCSYIKLVYVLAFIATAIGFSAFSQKPADSIRKEQPSNADSSRPGPTDNDDRRLDQLDIQLKQLDLKLDHPALSDTLSL